MNILTFHFKNIVIKLKVPTSIKFTKADKDDAIKARISNTITAPKKPRFNSVSFLAVDINSTKNLK